MASIAKGYGVDVIVGVVRQKGYRNFLVEIGGEVVASGVRKDGRPWVVGINNPAPEDVVNAVYRTVSLTNGAMAGVFVPNSEESFSLIRKMQKELKQSKK